MAVPEKPQPGELLLLLISSWRNAAAVANRPRLLRGSRVSKGRMHHREGRALEISPPHNWHHQRPLWLLGVLSRMLPLLLQLHFRDVGMRSFQRLRSRSSASPA